MGLRFLYQKEKVLINFLLNCSDAEISKMMEKLERYINNRALDKISLIALVIAYTILIFIGTIGNGLVCVVVARKPKMRTSRNLFIINLAISDLLLCFFTIPFSLVEISVKFWPFGKNFLSFNLRFIFENFKILKLSQSKNKQYFDSLFDTNFVAYNCYTV